MGRHSPCCRLLTIKMLIYRTPVMLQTLLYVPSTCLHWFLSPSCRAVVSHSIGKECSPVIPGPQALAPPLDPQSICHSPSIGSGLT